MNDLVVANKILSLNDYDSFACHLNSFEGDKLVHLFHNVVKVYAKLLLEKFGEHSFEGYCLLVSIDFYTHLYARFPEKARELVEFQEYNATSDVSQLAIISAVLALKYYDVSHIESIAADCSRIVVNHE